MKRFVETNDWREPSYRKLSPQAKHLRRYLWDNCDSAGVISVDLESISFHVGESVKEKHLAELGDWLERLPDGRVLIPGFTYFQCGTLSPACRAHIPVLKLIKSHGLEAHGILYHHSSRSLSSSLPPSLSSRHEQCHKEQEQEQEKEQYKEKEQEKEKDGRGVGRGIPPALESVKLEAAKIGLPETEAVRFHAYYESNGWRVGKNPMRSWTAALINWRTNFQQGTYANNQRNSSASNRPLTGADQRQVGIPAPSPGEDLSALLARKNRLATTAAVPAENGVATAPPSDERSQPRSSDNG